MQSNICDDPKAIVALPTGARPNVGSMKDEKAEFAARLRAALNTAGIEQSAAVVEKRFNARYNGPAVTAQAVSMWLNGRAIPRQDKMRVLAAIVGLNPHELQYGGRRLAEGRGAWDGLHAQDRVMLDAYLNLPPAKRKLVRDLVTVLSNRG